MSVPARQFTPRAGRAGFALGLLLAVSMLSSAGAGRAQELAAIQVSPRQRQLIGLQLATVENKLLEDQLRTTAIVEPDEQREGYVQTRFAGWIREVFVNQTYQYVSRGQPLFTIYSPDLVSAEQEYLLALGNTTELRGSDLPDVAQGAQSLVGAALERLRLFGVSAGEIRRLERQRTVRDAIAIDAPMSGYVVDWSALPNKYVQPETRLYTIADLATVWIYAAVFQNQVGEIKLGDPVTVTIDAYPGRTFTGRVDFIWQAIDPTTRTARVRCALPNPQQALKLGMYASIVLRPRLGRGLVIPDSGVLRTGTHDVVFIDRGGGYLQPVEVELGAHVGHAFVVRTGLQAGQRIVSSANFLIDSESQLQAALGTFQPPPPGTGGSAGAPAGRIAFATTPTPLRKGSNRMLITVRDSDGKPVPDAEVRVVFFMPAMAAMGMPAMRQSATAQALGGGKYAADFNLPGGGSWRITLLASRAGRQIARRQLILSVTGGMEGAAP